MRTLPRLPLHDTWRRRKRFIEQPFLSHPEKPRQPDSADETMNILLLTVFIGVALFFSS